MTRRKSKAEEVVEPVEAVVTEEVVEASPEVVEVVEEVVETVEAEETPVEVEETAVVVETEAVAADWVTSVGMVLLKKGHSQKNVLLRACDAAGLSRDEGVLRFVGAKGTMVDKLNAIFA